MKGCFPLGLGEERGHENGKVGMKVDNPRTGHYSAHNLTTRDWLLATVMTHQKETPIPTPPLSLMSLHVLAYSAWGGKGRV